MKVRTGIVAGQTQGLGDVVANITSITGIDRAALAYEQLTGKPCGCKERQQLLNQLFPLNNIQNT